MFVFHYYCEFFFFFHAHRASCLDKNRQSGLRVVTLVFNYLLSVTICSTLDKWEELNINPERNGNRKWKLERRRSSKNSSSEFLWWGPSRKKSLIQLLKKEIGSKDASSFLSYHWNRLQIPVYLLQPSCLVLARIIDRQIPSNVALCQWLLKLVTQIQTS